MSIWLILVFHLLSSLQPYQETKFQGLVCQETPWDCGPAAAATLLTLAGEEIQPWSTTCLPTDEGASLLDLHNYLQAHNWEVEGYQLNWEQLVHFFEHFPHRPLLAHRQQEQGHYVVLLGLVKGWLIVADPSSGVRALTSEIFLQDFSGHVLYFPNLPALSTVEKILGAVEQRLSLLTRAVDYY